MTAQLFRVSVEVGGLSFCVLTAALSTDGAVAFTCHLQKGETTAFSYGLRLQPPTSLSGLHAPKSLCLHFTRRRLPFLFLSLFSRFGSRTLKQASLAVCSLWNWVLKKENSFDHQGSEGAATPSLSPRFRKTGLCCQIQTMTGGI